MRSENLYILELCNFTTPNVERIKELAAEDLDYSYILGKLLINRVGALAYHTLFNNNLTIGLNREFINSLKTMYISAQEQSREFKDMLNELQFLLKDVSFKYALLKGSYLSNLYPCGIRTSNDIDIFIDKDGIDHLTTILLENGFEQGYVRQEKFVRATRAEILTARMNYGEMVPFVKITNRKHHKFFEIDINLSLDYKATANHVVLSSMLNSSEPRIKTDNGCLFTLSKEDFIIHLCCHLYKEATTYPWVVFGRDQGLYKYIDIYACLILENDTFFKMLIKRITTLGLSKECRYAFLALAKMYGGIFERLYATLSNFSFDALNTVFDPKTNKTFCYDMDILDWIFCNSKRNHLYET